MKDLEPEWVETPATFVTKGRDEAGNEVHRVERVNYVTIRWRKKTLDAPEHS